MSIESQLQWYDSLKNDVDYQIEAVKNKFAVSVEKRMKKSQKRRKDLAETLGHSPAYVTKVLRGDANVTISTMVQIAKALDCDVHIHMAPCREQVDWVPMIQNRKATVKTGSIDSETKAVTSSAVNFLRTAGNRFTASSLPKEAHGN